jgi:hypothetical protein
MGRYLIYSFEKRNNIKNSHPDEVGIPKFCIFNFDFCVLKITVSQFE